MAASNMLVASVAVIFAVLQLIQGEVIKGVTPLNSGTFDKILDKFNVVVVKFDESYPYGDKQDAFKALAEAAISQPQLVIGEVNVQDYGEKENSDLADRFGIEKANFPAYRLFKKGVAEPTVFTGDAVKSEEIKKWVIQETGIWLGLPACLETFDKLVKEFWEAPEAGDKRAAILEEARKEAATITEEPTKTQANIYVKTIEKIIEKGASFVDTEISRVQKLAEGKVSEKKRTQLKDRASILTSFQIRKKDEL